MLVANWTAEVKHSQEDASELLMLVIIPFLELSPGNSTKVQYQLSKTCAQCNYLSNEVREDNMLWANSLAPSRNEGDQLISSIKCAYDDSRTFWFLSKVR